MTKQSIQYTVRIDDPGLDRAVRRLAKKNKTSINETVILTLSKATGYSARAKKPTWAKYKGVIPADIKVDNALDEMRVVDPKDWQ